MGATITVTPGNRPSMICTVNCTDTDGATTPGKSGKSAGRARRGKAGEQSGAAATSAESAMGATTGGRSGATSASGGHTMLVQVLRIHTSCSHPLYVGQDFGALTIEGFPGTPCAAGRGGNLLQNDGQSDGSASLNSKNKGSFTGSTVFIAVVIAVCIGVATGVAASFSYLRRSSSTYASALSASLPSAHESEMQWDDVMVFNNVPIKPHPLHDPPSQMEWDNLMVFNNAPAESQLLHEPSSQMEWDDELLPTPSYPV